jgi:hypothetical protein
MEMVDLKIGEEEFDIFCNLTPKDKIAFLYDSASHGLDAAISRLIPFDKFNDTEKRKPIVNDLFQDTVYEELAMGRDRCTVLMINNSLHVNSSSLSWIKKMITKLFMDGHIVLRNKIAKKIPAVDKYRYYRCYDIIGQVPPICLS